MKTPFEKAFSIPNVKAGFKKCGIYPFNPDVVPAVKMTPSTVHKSLLSSFSSSDSSTPDPQSPSYFSGGSSDVLSVSDVACVVHSDQSTSHSGDAPASTSHSGDAPASTSLIVVMLRQVRLIVVMVRQVRLIAVPGKYVS